MTSHAESRVPLFAEHLWPEMEMNNRTLQAERLLTWKRVQTLVLTWAGNVHICNVRVRVTTVAVEKQGVLPHNLVNGTIF